MTDLVLPDGRFLDLFDTGSGGGANSDVLVFHHGTPGSSVVPRAFVSAARDRGLRVLSWSRPGSATSTRHPGRDVASVVTDTASVLDQLGIESAWNVGWSGGGPHTLACAALLPERIRGTASLAGVAPYVESLGTLEWFAGMGQDNLDEFGAPLESEPAVRAYLEAQRPGLVNISAQEIIGGMESLLPAVDRAFCTDEFGEDLAASFRRAVQVGVDGWLDDDLAFAKPWGFELSAISGPVAIWQGSEDLMVPFSHGVWLSTAIPNSRAFLLQGEGHLSVALGDLGAILDDLLAHEAS